MTVRILHVITLAVACIGLLIAAPAQAQEDPERSCSALLDEAQSAYLNGNYDAAIQQVAACLDQSGVEKEQAVRAYRLMSLAHLRQDELDAAREAIVNLLGVAPDYEADPVSDPPTYVSMVAIVRQEIQPQGAPAEAAEEERTPFFRRTSTWLGLGGVLLAGGAVAFFTVGGGIGGDGGAEPLPPPPGTP